METVVNLKGIKNEENPNWTNIFNTKSNYKLLYILTIIEYLMEDQENIEDEKKEENTDEKKEEI